MAKSPEAWAQGEDDPDFFSELDEATKFNNFKALFEVSLNLEGGEEIAPRALLYAYQEYLKTDPNGRATAEALKRLREDPANARMLELGIYYLHQSGTPGSDGIYAELVVRATAHLPAELDAGILLDPHLAEDAA